MAKSIKLNNETYIDSSGVIHEKQTLDIIIANIQANISKNSCINVICSSGSASISAGEQIPFNSIYAKVGDKFSLSSNSVKIGAGVKMVEVSATIWAYTSSRSWFSLYKNDELVATTIGKSGADSYTTLNITPKVLNVSENDTLLIKSSTALRVNSGANSNLATYMNVKQIA